MARVLVIGCGISGLIATKVLRDDRFDVVCVDKEANIAGCWNQAFDFVTLQASRDEYHYPGIPYPHDTPFRPGKTDVLRYWIRFVDNFHLHENIRLNTAVSYLGRDKADKTKWYAKFHVRRTKDLQYTRKYYKVFDFVVVASGIGYGNPRLANVPTVTVASFPGTIEHAIEVNPSFLPKSNEKVVLVGFGPTALAFADTYAHNACRKGLIHMVIREKRWFAPAKLLGFIPHVSVFFTRAAGVMLPAFTHKTLLEHLIHMTFVKWLIIPFWWILHLLVILSAMPTLKMVPDLSAGLRSLRNSIPVLPGTFFEQCRNGRITTHVPATIEALRENSSVLLSNGTVVEEVDRVIFCTGYTTDPLPWLDLTVRNIVLDNGRPKQLYRHIVAPGVKNLAFVGFGCGFHGCVTEFLAANWISSLFQGKMRLPSRVEMEKSASHVDQWKRDNLIYEPHYPYAIGARFLNYIDELMCDMGLTINRKSSAFAWLFEKWGPDDFETVPSERRSSLSGQ